MKIICLISLLLISSALADSCTNWGVTTLGSTFNIPQSWCQNNCQLAPGLISPSCDPQYPTTYFCQCQNTCQVIPQVTTNQFYNYTIVPVPISSTYYFQVKTSTDAHIGLFQSLSDIQLQDSVFNPQGDYSVFTTKMYEIPLSAWGNSQTAIRIGQQYQNQVVTYVGPLDDVNPNVFKSFWLKVTPSGGSQIISLGSGLTAGVNQFITYTNPNPISINYIAVSSGWGDYFIDSNGNSVGGAQWKFFYGCDQQCMSKQWKSVTPLVVPDGWCQTTCSYAQTNNLVDPSCTGSTCYCY